MVKKAGALCNGSQCGETYWLLASSLYIVHENNDWTAEFGCNYVSSYDSHQSVQYFVAEPKPQEATWYPLQEQSRPNDPSMYVRTVSSLSKLA